MSHEQFETLGDPAFKVEVLPGHFLHDRAPYVSLYVPGKQVVQFFGTS